MTTTLIPLDSTPTGLSVVSLADFRSASAPIGSVNSLLNSLTGSYGAVDIAVIRSVYHALEQSGVLARCDTLSFKMANETDSLRNWTGGVGGVNFGATYGARGFSLDGINDYINPSMIINGSGNYKLNDAHLGVYLTGAAETGTLGLISQGAGSQATILNARSGTGGINASCRVNSDTTSSFASGNAGRLGLWHAGRVNPGGGSAQSMFFETSLIGTAVVAETNLPTNSLTIGRQTSTYYAITVAGWFSSSYMNAARRAVLVLAFEMMRSHFVGAL